MKKEYKEGDIKEEEIVYKYYLAQAKNDGRLAFIGSNAKFANKEEALNYCITDSRIDFNTIIALEDERSFHKVLKKYQLKWVELYE